MRLHIGCNSSKNNGMALESYHNILYISYHSFHVISFIVLCTHFIQRGVFVTRITIIDMSENSSNSQSTAKHPPLHRSGDSHCQIGNTHSQHKSTTKQYTITCDGLLPGLVSISTTIMHLLVH